LRPAALVLAAAVVAASGCYESPVPLDPAPQADLDPGVVGSWRCLGAAPDADGEAITIAIARTRDRVYQADFIEDGKEPDRYEAYASLVKGKQVVNVRELKADAGKGKDWVFARYELLRPDVLEIGIADDDQFKGVEATAAGIRKHFESRAADPRLLGGFCVCVRQKSR
jgi:hypothetical protein